MPRRSIRLVIAGILISVLIALISAEASACGLAWPKGGYAATLAEEALITWNPATKVEHFIRRANIETDKPNLGFLVPTPTVPTLSEIDQDIFERLANHTRPRDVEKTHWNLSLLVWLFFKDNLSQDRAKSMPNGSVQVLESKTVAGYQATVLKAGNAGELKAWLQQHGYAVRPGLESWLEPYLRRHWAITAFKLSKRPASQALQLKALDMRFMTNTPFYPYREPLDGSNAPAHADKAPARFLRIYFLSGQAMTGAYDHPDPTNYEGGLPRPLLEGLRGPTQLLYSAAIPPETSQPLLAGLAHKSTDLPAKLWLTAFLDASRQRDEMMSDPKAQPAELYFYPTASRQTPYLPVTYHPRHIVLPLELPAAGGLLFWVWRRRRTKSAPAS